MAQVERIDGIAKGEDKPWYERTVTKLEAKNPKAYAERKASISKAAHERMLGKNKGRSMPRHEQAVERFKQTMAERYGEDWGKKLNRAMAQGSREKHGSNWKSWRAKKSYQTMVERYGKDFMKNIRKKRTHWSNRKEQK